MKNESQRSNASATEKRGVFEYVLLAVCIAVIACRATLTEAPGTAATPLDNIYSATISFLLIFAAISWFIISACRKQLAYRFSGIEYGLAVFVIASVIGVCIASNKREAINSFTMMVAPVLMAVVLAQILNSTVKVKVLLYVIAALGVVNAYECVDQFWKSNELTIAEYQRDPNSMLRRLNIEKGTFQQMLFEHRLYSKDVRGFFTTGNSAGSFAILALAATAALIIEKRHALKARQGNIGDLAARGLVAAMIIFGLVLTHSKGAIAAACAAAIIFAVYVLIGKRLARHKITVAVVLLILIIAGGTAIVWYGITHNTLPGGKSMLVRWQYWVGAARIYAAHPFAGAGPGSFAQYYPTYKIWAGLETVKDPHNFILSVLSQYGPLGLAGFLAALLVPFIRAIWAGAENPLQLQQDKTLFRKIAVAYLVFTTIILLIARPLVLRSELGNVAAVTIVVVVWLYLLPTAMFIIAFLFLSVNDKQTHLERPAQILLVCAIAGVLIHNLVDFAIFEPGVYTAFWAVVATVAAMDFNRQSRSEYLFRPSRLFTSVIVCGGMALIWAYTFFAVTPVTKCSVKIAQATSILENASGFAGDNLALEGETETAILQNVFDYANRRLYEAADDDKLSPAAPAINARLCVEFYKIGGRKDEKLLEWAQNRLLTAIERDPADFKNFKNLAEVFTLMAERLPADKQQGTLKKAYSAISDAIARYPGSERLRMEAGRLAERLGQKDEAIAQYKKAVEIEESYRIEFAEMYPGKPVFSRMGETEYKFAKERIKELLKN